jgi:hypothetical protein
MIAIRTATGYRSARIEYDGDDIVPTLESEWRSHLALLSLISGGDMLSLKTTGAIRVSNRKPARAEASLAELLADCTAEGIHSISIHDKHEHTLDEFGEWNMTCSDGEDLFLENVGDDGRWYHFIDGARIQEISSQWAA